MPSYAIITPVRNEADHFDQTIQSVVSQTVPPLAWVVVDDGSTDSTPQLVDAATQQYPWIHAVHRKDRGYRKQGGGVIEAFYDGYARLSSPERNEGGLAAPKSDEGGSTTPLLHYSNPPSPRHSSSSWDFLVKLDGDLSFQPTYFEQCFARFAQDPQLGIGGGRVYCRLNGATVEESPGDPSFHVRGATKIYRRAAWEDIGGLIRSPGWDTLDEVNANMLGWKTYSFPELCLLQLKPTGSADGSWKNWIKNGRANYISGYHPVFMLLKCLKRTFEPPYGLAAVGLFTGFCGGYLKRVPQVPAPDLIRYLRRQQVNRLMGRPSLWSEPPVAPTPRSPGAPSPRSVNG